MSKETDNHSFNERNSLTGNSGMLGLSGLKPKLQPIRIKAFLDMYGSDEEDSEDKGRDSNSDSECDDIQQLPDDTEEKSGDFLTTVTEESALVTLSSGKEGNISRMPDMREICLEETRKSLTNIPDTGVKSDESIDRHISRHFTNNFSIDERSQRRSDVRGAASIYCASDATATSQTDDSASKSVIHANRRSNVKFQVPDSSFGTPVIPVKNESASYSSAKHENDAPLDSKFEFRESTHYSKETRHPHPANLIQPEPLLSGSSSWSSGSSSALQRPSTPGSHLITDTPMKNNPPAGSTRPTPSSSHRNIFQTPQNSKVLPDSSKSHVQTPATIFGNWSKNHMAQTPLENRSKTSESRTQASSTVIPHQLSSHDALLYRGNEEKRVRRPLAETAESVQSNRQCENDKLAARYNAEALSLSNTHENHNRGPLEIINDRCSNKSVMQLEFKENRHPQSVEKFSINEKPARERLSGITREPIVMGSKETGNENLLQPRQDRSSFQVANPIAPTSEDREKKNLPERQSNVQVSIPSRIRHSNQGQTITVKGKEYLILGTLGEGMSGQVLRVQDVGNLDLRAIKVVDLSRMDKDCAQGCLQEISMLHKLQAPCIVKMFDHDVKYPMVHVVMEMGDTDFKSLLNSMSEKKRLPLTMVLYYWTEMLTAVKHIHDNGVIHSDLKPANFLLVRGRLKLIDFGIASSMNADMTSVVKNNPMGTINYISPETLMDVSGNSGDSPNRSVKYKITFKSDVWSLGCILYSLVYGYTPFHNIRTQWAKISAITNPQPKISFALPAGNDIEPTPPILIDVMRKCLQHDPKARPTVSQLLQIPYIPVKPILPNPVRDIPSNILMKIKYSLTDAEWRQFTEILEARRSQ